MPKEVKTNAMRILDRKKIHYEVITYECDEFIDGLHVADITGTPYDQSYKTLAARGKSGAYYVFVIPIARELDLKSAAKAVGEKSVELLHVKEINAVTGYIRGGVSPIGMKKQYVTVFHSDAQNYPFIYISGGRCGSTVKLAPADAAKAASGSFADICLPL